MQLDANNLYSWGMSQPLPYGGFKWINVDEFTNKFKGFKTNFFVERDLEYPKDLQDSHNYYPAAPEKLLIKDIWLSDYCNKLKEQFNLTSDKIPKLVTTLFDKGKYVVHGHSLQLYLFSGLK